MSETRDIVERNDREDACWTGTVTPQEARAAAQRFIDRAFNNRSKPQPILTIPASPQDDDVRIVAYITQSADLITRLRTENATLKAECEELKIERQRLQDRIDSQ